jgi:hypothetical protein
MGQEVRNDLDSFASVLVEPGLVTGLVQLLHLFEFVIAFGIVHIRLTE